jgi:uncharacterized membrane protein
VRTLACIMTVLVAGVGASAQTPSFTFVGSATGGVSSRVLAVSADGQTAAGYTAFSSSAYAAFVWSAAGGRYDFGLEPGLPVVSQAYALSGDGSTAAGTSFTVASAARAFRWTGPGTYQTLGVLANNARSYGEGVSGNGSVVVGHCEASNPSFGQAFRWTAAGGMQGLGYARPTDVYSDATAISRDAGTVVGWSRDLGGGNDAFVWTAVGGMRPLPQLPGTPFRGSYAWGVNFDGTVVIGQSGPTRDATMWRDGVPMNLGVAPGWLHSQPRGTSDDGSVVVGSMYSVTDFGAYVWTPAFGMEPMADYLIRYGVQIPAGWNLIESFGVSGDGRTFSGSARMATGEQQGFVATIPEPWSAAVVLVAFGGACGGGRRRSMA